MSFTLIKYTRTYSCPDDIKNFKIRVRIREKPSASNNEEATPPESKEWLTKVIGWQEKIFNKSEVLQFTNLDNCTNDQQKIYNKMIKDNTGISDSILSTYLNSDDYPEEVTKSTYLTLSSNEIQNEEVFDFKSGLVGSIKNALHCHELERMVIVADCGYYLEDTWIKCEKTLCSIVLNKTLKTLSIFPDFSGKEPYTLEMDQQANKTYLYFLEDSSTKISDTILTKETELLRKLSLQKISLQKPIPSHKFHLPPRNKLYVHLFFEILSASNFEYNDIYIQYFIDLPDKWSCQSEESLAGLTQTCLGQRTGITHFGHCFDLTLEYNIQNLDKSPESIPKSPYIYFEVISKDSWERRRTEGLAYKNLPVCSTGTFTYNLCCFRLSPQSISGNLKRFFIGDCSSYNDITWVGLPTQYEGRLLNKYGVKTIGTGELNLRIHVIHQSQAFMKEFNDDSNLVADREKLIFEKLNSSSLIKSVEQVLQAFKRARKNMIEARKNL